MPTLQDCLDRAARAIGRELTEQESADLRKRIDRLRKVALRDAPEEELAQRMLTHAEKMAEEVKVGALILKRNAALNARAKIRAVDELVNRWGDNPREGLKALLGGSVVDRFGSKNSVAALQSSIGRRYVMGMLSEILDSELHDIAKKDVLDRDIWKAWYEIAQEVPEKEVLDELPVEAVTLAKIFEKYSELARVEANQAGAWTRKRPGHVLRQTHDPYKIMGAGEEEWKAYVAQIINWEESFTDLDVTDRDHLLTRLYSDLSTGVHIKRDREGSAFKGPGNIGRKLSEGRVLVFKGPDAEFEYYKRFGAGESMTASVVHGLMHSARDIGLMRRLGPNAEANLEDIVADVSLQYRNEADPLRGDLHEEHHKLKKILWPVLTGEANVPWNATVASINQSIRNVEILGDLARAFLSGVSDIALSASQATYSGKRSMGNFLEELVNSTLDGVGRSRKLSPAERAKLASEMGVMIDAMANPMGRYMADTSIPGALSEWVNTFFKFNLLAPWQDNIRVGSVMGFTRRLYDNAALAFGDLEEGLQATLRQFGVQPEEWEVFRQLEAFEDSRGGKYLTPEAVMEAPNELVDMLPEVQARKQILEDRDDKLLQRLETTQMIGERRLEKTVERLGGLRQKAIERFEAFEQKMVGKLDKKSEYLTKRRELLEARMDQIENEIGIASWFTQKHGKDEIEEFIAGFDFGETTRNIQKKGRHVVGKQARKQGRHGQKLGKRRNWTTERVKKIEKELADLPVETSKDIAAEGRRVDEYMAGLQKEFDNSLFQVTRDIEAWDKILMEYRENVGKYLDQARDKARVNLSDRLRNMTSEYATAAATEPGQMERAIMLQGTQPGNALGEVTRHFWMYKSFSIAAMRKHMLRELHGYGPNKLKWFSLDNGSVFREMMNPTTSSFQGMARFMAGTTVLGGASLILKDLARGREPRKPSNSEEAFKFFKAAALQGGGMGIYGDFLFGEMRNRFGHDPISTMLGPTAGRASDIIDLYSRFLSGDDTAAKSVNFLLNNTPGVNAGYNLFWTRWALDYMFVNELQEMLNPGYLIREDQRARENFSGGERLFSVY